MSLPLTIQPSRRSLRARVARCGVMLVIFMAGGVAGYCVGTIPWVDFNTTQVQVMNQPDKFTEFLLAQLKKDLVLTDEQFPEVQKIIVRHHEGFDKIRRQTQPLFDKEMSQLEREMQGVLTPTQWTRYKEKLDRLKSRHRHPSSGGSPRPPGKDGYRGSGTGSGRRDQRSEPGTGRGENTPDRPKLEGAADRPLTIPKVDLPAKPADAK